MYLETPTPNTLDILNGIVKNETLLPINQMNPTQEDLFLVFVFQNTLIVWNSSRISNLVSMLG